VVESASLEGLCHVTTLAGLARDGLPSLTGPTLLMLGEVYREALDLIESQTTPLAAAAQQRC
jgi:hypothetical protein